MKAALMTAEDIIKYQLDPLDGLHSIENTAGQLARHFTINLVSPISFIVKHKVEHLRIESATSSCGFKKIYSANLIIKHAISLGKIITKPKDEIEKLNQLELAKTDIEILKSTIAELNEQIIQKETTLIKINKHLNLSFKRYNQLINEPLLDEDSILFLAGIVTRKCGIYFLIKDEKIVYVGQSINIQNRVQQHRMIKDFDRFTYVECKAEDLSKIEAMYINKLKPILNYNLAGRLVFPITIDYLQRSIKDAQCNI